MEVKRNRDQLERLERKREELGWVEEEEESTQTHKRKRDLDGKMERKRRRVRSVENRSLSLIRKCAHDTLAIDPVCVWALDSVTLFASTPMDEERYGKV